MALSESFEYKLEIIPPHSVIQVRRADIISRDGVEIARSYHRHVVSPGDDVSTETAEVQAVAGALWSSKVIDSYLASIPEPKLEITPVDETAADEITVE